MTRDEAIPILSRHAPELRARGVLHIALFGSTARNEASPDSDVDLLVELDPQRSLSLVDLVEIKHYLSDVLNHPADLAMRGQLRPLLRDSILAEAVDVF